MTILKVMYFKTLLIIVVLLRAKTFFRNGHTFNSNELFSAMPDTDMADSAFTTEKVISYILTQLTHVPPCTRLCVYRLLI